MSKKTKNKNTPNNLCQQKKSWKLDRIKQTLMKNKNLQSKNENWMKHLKILKKKKRNKRSLKSQSWPSIKKKSRKKKLNTGRILTIMKNS